MNYRYPRATTYLAHREDKASDSSTPCLRADVDATTAAESPNLNDALITRGNFLRYVSTSVLVGAVGEVLAGCGPQPCQGNATCASTSKKEGPFPEAVLLRSLSDLTPQHPQYPGDAALLDAIATWSRRVLLVGKNRDLCINPQSVAQIASVGRNTYSYVAPIENVDVLRSILCAINDPALEAEIGATLKSLDVFGAVLYLHRKLKYAPGKKPSERTRCTVADAYWVDVYVRAQRGSDSLAVPVVRLYAHFAAPYSFRIVDDDQKRTTVANWTASAAFQEPDDVILTWHELATALGVDRRAVYLRACLRAAGASRQVFGYQDAAGGPPPMIVSDDPADNDVPPIARVAVSLYPQAPFYVPGRPAPYALDVIAQPTFTFPPSDLASFAALWQVNLQWVHISQPPIPLPADIARDAAVPPGEGWYLSEIPQRITAVPKPEKPTDDAFGLAAIQFLSAASGGAAIHVGNGYFRVKAPGLAKLAAGTGNWGSPETIAVLLVVDGVAAPITGAVGGGIIVVAAALEWRYRDDIQKELSACYEKKGQDCEECVRGSLGYQLADAQLVGGAMTVGSAIVLGGAACAASFGVLCVVAILGGVYSSWEILDSLFKQEEMLNNCPNEFG
jgi:hypothetical protein